MLQIPQPVIEYMQDNPGATGADIFRAGLVGSERSGRRYRRRAERWFRCPDDYIIVCPINLDYVIAPPQDTNCGVYFVREGLLGPIKIGYALDVERRLKDLQTGNPRELVLLAVMPESNEYEETILHTTFQFCALRGEWYEPHERLTRLIASIIEGTLTTPMLRALS